jgi:hypothetical protein
VIGFYRVVVVLLIDLDASLGEQSLDIAVGQSLAQVPANGKRDHFWWEAEPGEARRQPGVPGHDDGAPSPPCPTYPSLNATVAPIGHNSYTANLDGA